LASTSLTVTPWAGLEKVITLIIRFGVVIKNKINTAMSKKIMNVINFFRINVATSGTKA
jgi:hypothetical protein